MIIKRIKAVNFKTYQNLDLELAPDKDRPIILIGGPNGGGKTTLFEAIYGALYGLDINNKNKFLSLVNAGISSSANNDIFLEIYFNGKVLNVVQNYVLTRIYRLNDGDVPIEVVKLNMNGNIFNYSSAEPLRIRSKAESEVNKIIRANLPRELSHYFLFDAMQSGSLLKEDEIGNVIKENVENVMGLKKFLQLANCSSDVYESMTAQRINQEKERTEYINLVESKKLKEKELKSKQTIMQDIELYLQNKKDEYDNLKIVIDQESNIKARIQQMKKDIDIYNTKQKNFRDESDSFIKMLELNIGLPKLAEAFYPFIDKILNIKKEITAQKERIPNREQIETLVNDLMKYLDEKGISTSDIRKSDLVEYLNKDINHIPDADLLNNYDQRELAALDKLINSQYANNYPMLNNLKNEIINQQNQLISHKKTIQEYELKLTGSDTSLINSYEGKKSELASIKVAISALNDDIKKIEAKIHKYDITKEEEPDPRYEMVKKLKPFFLDAVSKLLIAKRKKIEDTLVTDLNINLIPYKNVIQRVELSNDSKEFAFKIYHVSGNEINLAQLNTASKQMVVQCLLKALHQFGDYDPPVMIDTVMGVLDESSRETVLENYFPQLSHQTILLSSDSEIRVDKDLVKIYPFISKLYTLRRDPLLQKTDIVNGYFGEDLL